MDPITGLAASQAIQGVTRILDNITSSDSDEKVQSTAKISSDFDSMLRSKLSLDQENSVSEEELFSGLVGERIFALKGEEGLKAYEDTLSNAKKSNTRSDGYTSVENATYDALSSLVEQGVLSKEEKANIKGEAFTAAQLDGNENALYDGRGGANDDTVAKMEIGLALQKAREAIEKIQSGEKEVKAGSDVETDNTVSSNNNEVDGTGGFLFKPVSEGDGNLVVLLPAKYSDNVASLVLKDSEGNVLEDGRPTGQHNPDPEGLREHFRFNKPGSQYGDNVTVQVTLNDGTIIDYLIEDTSERND